jgi:hypothetical protein
MPPNNKHKAPYPAAGKAAKITLIKILKTSRGLTKKAEPPPTCDVNRDSGTDSANGGWLRRLVRPRLIIQNHNRTTTHAGLSFLLSELPKLSVTDG